MRTPQARDSLIGTLFVGYSGLPIFMQVSNQPFAITTFGLRGLYISLEPNIL